MKMPALPKIPDLMPVLQTLKGKDLELNVTMMGGRRCGKTSVLAAMEDCFQKTIYKDTNIVCYSEDETTLHTLRAKKAELDAYFTDRKGRSFQPDSTPTSEVACYSFYIGLRGNGRKKEDGRIHVNFYDYPGEWLVNHQDDLNEIVEKSRILLIAVDTPYLLEEGGKFNRLRNNCDDVSNAIIRSGFADKGPGMILFVPLKCEKYRTPLNRHSPGPKEVRAAVEKSYEHLIDYVKRSGECFAAITPIFTLGDAVFSDFARDDSGDIIMNGGIPQQANYIFTDEAGNAPRPQFCEQPLYYVLAYTLIMAKKSKDKKRGPFAGVLNLFQEAILHWTPAKDYLAEYDAIHERIAETLKTTAGYGVVSPCDWMEL